MENQNQEEGLFSKLNIAKERGEFLTNKCRDIYLREMANEVNKKDVSDILWEARESCSNASEDMLVCYTIGAIHSFFIQKLMRSQALKNIMLTLDNIFKDK